MKIYSTKETELIIEKFSAVIDGLHNKSAYKSLLDEELIAYSKEYSIEEINKSKEGVTIESYFLMKNNAPIACIVLQNGNDVSNQIDASVLEASYNNIKNF